MTPRFGPVTLVYDGACHFCIRSLRGLKRFDPLDRMQLVDGTIPANLARFPELRDADLASAMYAVADGRAYRGFDAFRRAMWASPYLFAVAFIGYLPGVPFLGRRLYDWVARNRHALGCSSSCSISHE